MGRLYLYHLLVCMRASNTALPALLDILLSTACQTGSIFPSFSRGFSDLSTPLPPSPHSFTSQVAIQYGQSRSESRFTVPLYSRQDIPGCLLCPFTAASRRARVIDHLFPFVCRASRFGHRGGALVRRTWTIQWQRKEEEERCCGWTGQED